MRSKQDLESWLDLERKALAKLREKRDIINAQIDHSMNMIAGIRRQINGVDNQKRDNNHE